MPLPLLEKEGVHKNHLWTRAVQEVFVVLLGKVSWMATHPPDSFRGWLRTVTLNKCRDYFRRQRRAVEPELLQKLEVNQQDPADLFTEQEYRAFVSRAALQLMQDAFSETTWKACWSSVVEGSTAKEIAQELGISENAVYLARGRVLKRLREELEGLWE